MSNFKEQLKKYWTRGYYTVAQMRSVTTCNGTSKKFSYDEFYEVIGITVAEYDNNVDVYKDMKYKDIQAYLADHNSSEQ